MLPDDGHRSRLQATIESLRYWVPTIADIAYLSEGASEEAWTISVAPKVEGGCPFTMTLRAEPRFDVTVAGETYTNRALSSFDLPLPLIEAITDGRVVQRRWISVATGALRAVETIVTLADGSVWRDGHTVEGAAHVIPRLGTERHDHHFLAYRR